MQIKKAGCEEADFLIKTDQICFSEAWNQKNWETMLLMPQYRCYVVLEEEIRKGFLLTSTAADEGELLKIGVLPEYRHQNLGKIMLDQALKDWKNENVTKLYLEVRESNQFAKRLYHRTGFAEAGIRKNYYRNPTEHAIIYTRNI